MDKRMFWTVLLTAAVILLWQYFIIQPAYEARKAAEVSAPAADTAPAAPAVPAASAVAETAASPLAPAGAALPAADAGETAPASVVPPDSRTLVTSGLQLRWENRSGGVLTAAQLPTFQAPDGAALELIPVPDKSTAMLPAWGEGLPAGNAGIIAAGDTFIVARFTPAPGLVATAALAETAPYLLTLRYHLRNAGTATVKLNRIDLTTEGAPLKGSLGIGWGPNLGDTAPDRSGLNTIELRYRLGSGIETLAAGSGGGGFFASLFGGAPPPTETHTQTIPGNILWAAVTNRYFIAAVIADEPAAGLQVVHNGQELAWRLVASELVLAPGEEKTLGFRVYLGPKDYDTLKGLGIRLEETINYGWFDWLGVFLLGVMKYIYRLIPNFGWAIIILTIMIRVVLYPLTYKSYQSMKQMQTLQPKMQELRAKYPNNQQKQQEEIMKLYREEKINPLMGCLPILLQLPIFIALFRMLEYALELRAAPFWWWITDLSQPDTIGALPAWLPFVGGAAFNLLPLAMGATMFIQQKMSMTGLNPQQEKMMLVMPFVLTLMLWNFPSGLMLYWSVSNLIGLAQQKWMTGRGGSPLPPAVKPKPAARK